MYNKYNYKKLNYKALRVKIISLTLKNQFHMINNNLFRKIKNF